MTLKIRKKHNELRITVNRPVFPKLMVNNQKNSILFITYERRSSYLSLSTIWADGIHKNITKDIVAIGKSAIPDQVPNLLVEWCIY